MLLPGSCLERVDTGLCCASSLQGDTYFTVHVTPQKGCSYVSFETNLLAECYDSLINAVIGIFKPQKYTLTLFASQVGVVCQVGGVYVCIMGETPPPHLSSVPLEIHCSVAPALRAWSAPHIQGLWLVLAEDSYTGGIERALYGQPSCCHAA